MRSAAREAKLPPLPSFEAAEHHVTSRRTIDAFCEAGDRLVARATDFANQQTISSDDAFLIAARCLRYAALLQFAASTLNSRGDAIVEERA